MLVLVLAEIGQLAGYLHSQLPIGAPLCLYYMRY